MVITALAKLRHRSAQLNVKLKTETATEVAAARELLRLSLVELYELGYWRDQPDQLRIYMRLFRAGCSPSLGQPNSLTAPPSMSAPDRMARYSP